jgi:hypothetical protein
MALFSISDIIIVATLLVNALALASTKLGKATKKSSSSSTAANVEANDSSNNSHTAVGGESEYDDDEVTIDGNSNSSSNSNKNVCRSPLWRLRELAFRVRQYSCIIVLWNIIFFFLMFSVFPS